MSPTASAPRSPRAVLGPLPWWSAELLGAAALVLALPPFGVWPLAGLAPALFAAGALAGGRALGAWLRASLAGLLLVLAGAWWIAETDIVSLLFVAAVEAPLIGLVGPLAVWSLRRGSLFPTLPTLWVAVEAFRVHWPDVGFAWLQVGHALAASPTLVQVADLGGALAVGFVGAAAGTALLCWRLDRRGLFPSLAAVGLALLYGLVRPATLPEPEPGPLLVSIQPGFPQELKQAPESEAQRWQVCRELALDAARRHPTADMLVFPETMWPGHLLHDLRVEPPAPTFAPPPGPPADELARVLAQLAARDAERLAGLQAAFARPPHVLVGAALLGFRTPDGPAERRENVAVLVDPAGRERGRYAKVLLIPGGEKVPLLDVVPAVVGDWIRSLVLSVAGFDPSLSPGSGPALLELEGTDFGVTICFENAYGHYTRAFVQRGARFLVNLSNEGWFDVSPEFDHMQLQSVLRAVETRRALFRSTNTGISCLVRPDGRLPRPPDKLVVDGADRAVRGVFAARVPLHSGGTLYTLTGDHLAWLAAAWLLAACWLRRPSRLP